MALPSNVIVLNDKYGPKNIYSKKGINCPRNIKSVPIKLIINSPIHNLLANSSDIHKPFNLYMAILMRFLVQHTFDLNSSENMFINVNI